MFLHYETTMIFLVFLVVIMESLKAFLMYTLLKVMRKILKDVNKTIE